MTLSVQFMTMIVMTLGGFYLGMAQDTFRRFSIHWEKRVILPYVMEVSFWLTQTLLLFYLLFLVNAGELRVYVFLACLLGFAAYQALAATLYKRLLERMINICTTVYRFSARMVHAIIIKPITFLIGIVVTCVLFLLQLLWKILQKLLKGVYLPLKWTLKQLYRILPKSFKKFLHKLAGFYSKMKNIVLKSVDKLTSWRR
ncbi:spore cortex biosynthesis protein YabQ [Oceanobacillus halotolerans]|uniref:spore cortex biosynthesis protein YabQ n=1 Tax=Oceanobacillus halotolerans TaxID=2663380 RepID=UPI0013DCBE24|nr:spore cortex biosynthesis protein YabQ [Oceanobacillus halotolerans]